MSLHVQGRSEGTSSVAFEVLIIKSEIDFINLFIFNCLTSNINLFIFSCLTSNINLFNFNCLTSNFCFPKNIFFASRRERLFIYERASLVSGFQLTREMVTYYLRDTIFVVPHPVHEHTKMRISNKRYRTNTARILWRPKGPQLWGNWFRPFR